MDTTEIDKRLSARITFTTGERSHTHSSFLFPILALKSPAIKRSGVLVVLSFSMSFITCATLVQSWSSLMGSFLTRNVCGAVDFCWFSFYKSWLLCCYLPGVYIYKISWLVIWCWYQFQFGAHSYSFWLVLSLKTETLSDTFQYR